MAYFEGNLHTQISSGDSILSTTFCGDHVVDTTVFCSLNHNDFAIGNGIARDVHCDIIICYDIIVVLEPSYIIYHFAQLDYFCFLSKTLKM